MYKVMVLAASPLVVGVFAGESLAGGPLYRNAMESSIGWTSTSDADTEALFGYDYSADGIPEAPNSIGSDAATTGVRMRANIVDPTGAAQAMLMPTGQNFTGSYRLRFDAWTNYDVNERVNGGSAGTTEFIGGGIGFAPGQQVAEGGYSMFATNDGGSGSDWRVFAGTDFLDPEQMTGGSRNGFVEYYSDFLPGVAPPMAQAQDSFDLGVAGSPGFQWLTFEIFATQDGKVIVTVEKPDESRLRITEILVADYPGVSTDGNIGISYADLFSSVSARPDLTFGIVDNVVVDLPSPGGAALLTIGAFGMTRRRRD